MKNRSQGWIKSASRGPWTVVSRLRLRLRLRLPTVLAVTLGLGSLAFPGRLVWAQTPSEEAPGSQQVDQTFDAKTRGEIDIRSSAGTIRVIGEDRPTARVVGRLGADVARLESFVDGRYLRFIAHPPSALPKAPRALDSELVFYLPKGSDLHIQTLEAQVEIEGIQGRIRIDNGAGDSKIQGEPRRIDAVSVTGDFRLKVKCPDVELKTVSGAMLIEGAIENLIAETVESQLLSRAEIEVEALLRTVTGRIDFEGRSAPTARIRLHSSSGPVRLLLDPDIAGAFSLSSDRGELTNGLGPSWSSKAGRLQDEWKRGESPRRFEIETFDGDIQLETVN